MILAKTNQRLKLYWNNRLPKMAQLLLFYTGNGAHWAGMGQKLLKQSKRFTAIIKEIDALMLEKAGFSIISEIETGKRFDDTSVAQPVLFAIQVAITTLFNEQGHSRRRSCWA